MYSELNTKGIIAPRTNGFRVNGARFYNFASNMSIIQSCSECHNAKLWVTGGKTSFFNNISYNNIEGNYIFW